MQVKSPVTVTHFPGGRGSFSGGKQIISPSQETSSSVAGR